MEKGEYSKSENWASNMENHAWASIMVLGKERKKDLLRLEPPNWRTHKPPVLPSHYKPQSVGFEFGNILKLYKLLLIMSIKKLLIIFRFGVDTEWRKVVSENNGEAEG